MFCMFNNKKATDCSHYGNGGSVENSLYRITCFMKEGPTKLFPMLLPLQFTWTERQSITWSSEKLFFKIVPFASAGREKSGYRIHFNGNPEELQYLMDQFLSTFQPEFTGIEWVHESDKSQTELIRLADRNHFTRSSIRGIYEREQVGVVLLPSNTVHLQIRNHSITLRNLSEHMRAIEITAQTFLEKPVDLFSFAEEVLI